MTDIIMWRGEHAAEWAEHYPAPHGVQVIIEDPSAPGQAAQEDGTCPACGRALDEADEYR